MAVSLYRKTGDTYTNYFHWLYDGPQWWGTGFSTIVDLDLGYHDVVQISCIDFSSDTDMLDALAVKYRENYKSKYLVFDFEDHKLWIMW